MPEIPLSWHRLQWLTLGTARFGAVSILAPHDAEDPLVRAIHRLAANPLGRGIPHHHVYELERLAYLGRVFASSKPFQSRADRMKRSGLISCGGQADDARDPYPRGAAAPSSIDPALDDLCCKRQQREGLGHV